MDFLVFQSITFVLLPVVTNVLVFGFKPLTQAIDKFDVKLCSDVNNKMGVDKYSDVPLKMSIIHEDIMPCCQVFQQIVQFAIH